MLLVASGIEKAWGDRLVLRDVDLVVKAGERVGLVGPNGCGKSTLLEILAGVETADFGKVTVGGGIGYLGQEPTLPAGTVDQVARGALAWHAELLRAWEAAVEAEDEETFSRLQTRLDSVGWDLSHQVAAVLDRLNAPPGDADVSMLSGGERRRVALARALLASPDLLLLDEPTNHLDAETVTWLEGFLAAFQGAVVLVTHDRYLLESVATRIVEVEAGRLVNYEGSYADYLVERAERQFRLERMDSQRLALIQREAAWASKSPAARSTKQKARLDRLAALQSQEGVEKRRSFSFEFKSGAKFGRTLLEARGLRKSYDGRRLLWDLDLDVGPGERLGIVGPNGIGKSTLLGIIRGIVEADAGTVTRASRLKVAVLDQERTGLKENDTVFEAAGAGNDQVVLGDVPIHVASFLERFLFNRDMLEQKVSGLSGGERARLLLARLMLQGSSLLLLDEPTNDLDLTTLRVLEEALLGFDGAAIVVTHDRAFLDRVCTAVLAFHGDGRIVKYASRQQWLAALVEETRAKAAAARALEAKPVVAAKAATAPAKAPMPSAAAVTGKQAGVRLSYKESQELAGLPARLDAMESEKAGLELSIANPATWRTGDGVAQSKKLAELVTAIEVGWARWEALAARK